MLLKCAGPELLPVVQDRAFSEETRFFLGPSDLAEEERAWGVLVRARKAEMCRRALLDADGGLVLRGTASKGSAEVSQPLGWEWRNKSRLETLLGMRQSRKSLSSWRRPGCHSYFLGLLPLFPPLRFTRGFWDIPAVSVKRKVDAPALGADKAGAVGIGWKSPGGPTLTDQGLLVPTVPPTSRTPFQS